MFAWAVPGAAGVEGRRTRHRPRLAAPALTRTGTPSLGLPLRSRVSHTPWCDGGVQARSAGADRRPAPRPAPVPPTTAVAVRPSEAVARRGHPDADARCAHHAVDGRGGRAAVRRRGLGCRRAPHARLGAGRGARQDGAGRAAQRWHRPRQQPVDRVAAIIGIEQLVLECRKGGCLLQAAHPVGGIFIAGGCFDLIVPVT